MAKKPLICLGIESTAHTFGIAIVDGSGKVLANEKDSFITEQGGMIPHEVAAHHRRVNEKVLAAALDKAKIKLEDVDIISFSQSPGLPPALLAGRDFAVELRDRIENAVESNDAADGRRMIASQSSYSAPQRGPASSASASLQRDSSKVASRLADFTSHRVEERAEANAKASVGVAGGKIVSRRGSVASSRNKPRKIPIIGVNHCIAHLEIGRLTTKAKDPVMLYASGANTQVIAYEAKKYRIFGETLDQGIGNAIDSFGRYAGIGFPAGPKLDILAREGKQYIELPYTVKGMDVSFSGILTKLKQLYDKMNSNTQIHSAKNVGKTAQRSFGSHRAGERDEALAKSSEGGGGRENSIATRSVASIPYTLNDLAYSMQETMFAMLVEVSERAMAHTGKKELLLGGGVACNKRLQEMCRIMCEERKAKFYCPENKFLVDNAAMIAWQGLLEYTAGHKGEKASDKDGKIDIKPYLRTDEIEVKWRK